MAKLIDAKDGKILLDELEIADTFWKRFKGLQLRRSMPESSGILLSPCQSLHTCFMRFPIDVIMLDRENLVLGTRLRIRPWRAVICLSGTARVIEVSPGSVDVAEGTQLVWMDS